MAFANSENEGSGAGESENLRIRAAYYTTFNPAVKMSM
jgi:hypothetical protein